MYLRNEAGSIQDSIVSPIVSFTHIKTLGALLGPQIISSKRMVKRNVGPYQPGWCPLQRVDYPVRILHYFYETDNEPSRTLITYQRCEGDLGPHSHIM